MSEVVCDDVRKKQQWDILDEMPEGWKVDKTCGSPLLSCVFITNGKSVLNGQKRALLRVKRPLVSCVEPEEPTTKDATPIVKHNTGDESNYEFPALLVNDLARKRMMLKLLADIKMDMMVCEIEGWSKAQYLDDLKGLINSIGQGLPQAIKP